MHITPKGFKVFMATCHGEDNAEEKRAARLGATKCRRHESRRDEGPQSFYSRGFVLGSFPVFSRCCKDGIYPRVGHGYSVFRTHGEDVVRVLEMAQRAKANKDRRLALIGSFRSTRLGKR